MRIGPRRLEAAQSLSSRIWVDQRAPAAAVERLPRSFGLGEAVGDGVDSGGVMAEPAMAPFNLDVLCQRAGTLDAPPPGADTARPTEDRGGRDRRRLGERGAKVAAAVVGALAAGHLIDSPRVGRTRMSGEWTAERNHHFDVVRAGLGKLARIETAEAPADKAHLAAGSSDDIAKKRNHSVGDAVARAVVPTLTPAGHIVSVIGKKGSQRTRRDIARHQTGKDQDRTSVASRGQAQQWQTREERSEFVNRAALQKKQGFRRRRERGGGDGHDRILFQVSLRGYKARFSTDIVHQS